MIETTVDSAQTHNHLLHVGFVKQACLIVVAFRVVGYLWIKKLG